MADTMGGADLLVQDPRQARAQPMATSGANVAARMHKLTEAGFSELWKSVGAIIEVWGWEKQGPRRERKTWTLRREAL